MKILASLAALFLFTNLVFSASFTSQPSMTRVSADSCTISFAVTENCDVEVSIVNTVDSTIVRHLAAGVLGVSAPAPFVKNSLTQTIGWNSCDDFGNKVMIPDNSLKVRVRAGMSLSLQNLVGDNPYAFTPYRDLHGIVVDAEGYVYVCGNPGRMTQEHWFADTRYIRKYDKNGSYVKTLFPFPSNLPLDKARGWGIYENSGGPYVPRWSNTSMPVMSRTTLAGDIQQTYQPLLQFVDKDGNLVFGSYKLQRFGRDGSIGQTGTISTLLQNPTAPSSRNTYAMVLLTPLPDGNRVLMSGIFTYTGTVADSTGFYCDGQVYRVNLTTGVVESWLKLPIDSLPKNMANGGNRQTLLGGDKTVGSIMGTAVDSSGRIYVCDRFHKRIGVYDTSAALIGSIALPNSDHVAVSKRTGAIYVVTRALSGGVKLLKFGSFASGMAKVCEVSISSTMLSTSNFPGSMSLAVNDIDAIPVVWVGAANATVRAYRDGGAQFELVKDFLAESKDANSVDFTGPNQTFGRVAVDRKSETVYINDDWGSIFKIENWKNPVMRACSTIAGKQIYAADMALSPDYRYMYVLENSSTYYRQYHHPIKRYTNERRHAPANWANSGSNMLTPEIYARYAPCSGVRGLSINKDGRVAVINRCAVNAYNAIVFPDSGSKDTLRGTIRAGSLTTVCGGVKYDWKGNLYLGARVRTSQYVVPTPWIVGTAIDTGFKYSVGSIVRLDGEDTGSVTANTITGGMKSYNNIPLGPFSNDIYSGGAGCVCRSPRFEVDPYGRIFSPGGITGKVTVADNDGNIIMTFGEYGNMDSRGTLPALTPTQELAVSSGIPLCFPVAVAASEDYIYVCDYSNSRLTRVKMNYSADNMPGLTDHYTPGTPTEHVVNAAPSLKIASGPLPFTAFSSITLHMPTRENVKLMVCDVNGRQVKMLVSGSVSPGLNRFVWDGTDSRGHRMAAGVYVYHLTAGNKIISQKTVLAK
ncbi:MAG: hypothetical protein JNL74_18130 [Fibrobacteres bacterium]|nr:hypothetical protein [Fibrobacterota bacterium]